MTTSVLIPIRCTQCGRLYHVPPASLERRAKCRPCGNEFDLPKANVDAPRGRRRIVAHQSAPQDRRIASQLAALNAGRRRTNTVTARRLAGIGGLVALVCLCFFLFDSLRDQRRAVDAANFQRGHFVRLTAPNDATAYRSVVELVEADEPSVVQIESDVGMGSGFVLDESGLVVTCHHCVEGAIETTVTFADGWREKVLRVRRGWANHDIAILQISKLRPLKPLPLEKRAIKKGEPVVAFGAPQGLSFSISEGSVSAIRTGRDLVEILRRPPYNALAGADIFHLAPSTSVVQITAAAMPGSSGGPVVNFSGNVLGICSFGLRHGGQQFGFCVSVEDIRRVAKKLDGKLLPTSDEIPATRSIQALTAR